MKQPTFFEGVAVALVASLGGAAVYAALTAFLPSVWALQYVIAGLALAYVGYLLTRTRTRVGRITTIAVWVVAAGATWLAAPPLALYLLAHVSFIWLIRSLYFYASTVSALIDLGLSGLGVAASLWALAQSGSVFLAIWCFFLVQALHVAVPKNLGPKRAGAPDHRAPDDRFTRAQRAAESALRKLLATRY